MYRALSGRIIFYLFFLLIIDMCFAPLIAVADTRPVLLYLMMLYAAFEWHWEKTFMLAFAAGLLRDAVSSHPFGVETTVLVLASFGMDFLIHKIERKSWLMRFGVAFIYILTVLLSQMILMGFLGAAGAITWQTIGVCFTSAFYTTLCMPLFFYFTAKWFSSRPASRQYELFD